VKKNSYINFIEENTPDFHQYRGDIQHISGKVLGSHKGIYRFTHGQREGLGVSWKEPLYVADIDSASRTIKVAEKRYLAEDKFTVSCLNWFDSPLLYKDILVKVRYNSLFHDCRLKLAGDKAIVLLNDKVEALTPGQIAVFYCKDMVLGAGIIQRN
jgi:tRNA-specific 2-thiouridylase